MKKMEKNEVEIQQTSSFEKRLEEALTNILQTKNPAVEIPEANGMMLVRDGTPEADERKRREGAVLYQKQSGTETFLVCLN